MTLKYQPSENGPLVDAGLEATRREGRLTTASTVNIFKKQEFVRAPATGRFAFLNELPRQFRKNGNRYDEHGLGL